MDDGYTFYNAIRIHQLMYSLSYHTTIKPSPNNIHFRRSLSNVMDTFHPITYNIRLDEHLDYMLCSNLHKLYEEIYEKLNNLQNLQNKALKNSKLRHFKVKVMLYMYTKGNLHTKCSGLYKAIERVNNIIYKTRFLYDIHSPPIQIHVNKLKLVPQRNRWVSSSSHQNSQDKYANSIYLGVNQGNNQNLNSSSQSDKVEVNVTVLILCLTQHQILVPLQMTTYQQLYLHNICTFQPKQSLNH